MSDNFFYDVHKDLSDLRRENTFVTVILISHDGFTKEVRILRKLLWQPFYIMVDLHYLGLDPSDTKTSYYANFITKEFNYYRRLSEDRYEFMENTEKFFKDIVSLYNRKNRNELV